MMIAARCSLRTLSRLAAVVVELLLLLIYDSAAVEASASTEDFGAARQLLHASTVADWDSAAAVVRGMEGVECY